MAVKNHLSRRPLHTVGGSGSAEQWAWNQCRIHVVPWFAQLSIHSLTGGIDSAQNSSTLKQVFRKPCRNGQGPPPRLVQIAARTQPAVDQTLRHVTALGLPIRPSCRQEAVGVT